MKIIGDIFGILTLIIIVAIVAVLVSNRANTANVIQAFATGIGNMLGVATAPVTGEKVNIDTSYPDAGAWGMNTSFANNF